MPSFFILRSTVDLGHPKLYFWNFSLLHFVILQANSEQEIDKHPKKLKIASKSLFLFRFNCLYQIVLQSEFFSVWQDIAIYMLLL